MARSHNRKKATPRVSDGYQIITINIPAKNRVITLHAQLAAHYSNYFSAALSIPSEEARTLSFTLDEPATDYTVSCFASWVYAAASERCAMVAYLRDVLGLDTPEKVIDNWLLGDYLQAFRFMDHLTTLLCKILRDAPHNFEIERQITRLPEGSGMWRLLIAFHAKLLSDPAVWHENGPAASSEALGARALVEISRSLAAQLATARPCVRKLDDVGYVGATMRAGIESVLGNGTLDPKQ